MGRWWNCRILGRFRAHPVSPWPRTTGMVSVILIGVLGGLITGISPCIVPVLPVIFLSGSAGVRRPLLVVAGLVLSFSVSTLLGSMLLQLFSLPANVIRGTGLIMLALIGLGLIFPAVESVLERPFARIPQPAVRTSRGGWIGFGARSGVRAVRLVRYWLRIVVAGATGSIGPSSIALTIAFGIGVAAPLAVFALAGQQITNRVSAFRAGNAGFRIAGGVTMVVLSIALALDLPATLQRAIPDYTTALQHRGGTDQIEQKLNLGGIITDENRRLSNCHNGNHQLEDCGPVLGFTGIAGG
ncbi:cytochrome c biogenesis protein DipZ [Mycolicibacterium aubagnense]